MDKFEPTHSLSMLAPKDAEIDFKKLYQAVKINLPNGVMTSVTVNDGENPQNVMIVKSVKEDENVFTIPLSRHLTDMEFDRVKDAFTRSNGWILRASGREDELEQETVTVSDDAKQFYDFCTAMAKIDHQKWMEDRIGEGWRYGPNVSMEQKTHPLLMPWEQLPTSAKKVDTRRPKLFLDFLSSHGFIVLDKENAEALIQKVRGCGIL